VPKPAPKPVEKDTEEGEVTDEKVECISCGKRIKANWKKCPFCGQEQ
jgi:hypothetical protein